MSAGRLLVIAPEGALRRSLVFALESDGFELEVRDEVPPIEAHAGAGFDCTVLDQSALSADARAAAALCGIERPVVLLAHRPPAWIAGRVSAVVDQPAIGDTLIEAVRGAIAGAGTASA